MLVSVSSGVKSNEPTTENQLWNKPTSASKNSKCYRKLTSMEQTKVSKVHHFIKNYI